MDDQYEFEGRMVDSIIDMMCLASTEHCDGTKEDHDLSMRVMAEMLVTGVMFHNHGDDQRAIEADLKKMLFAVRSAFTLMGAERLRRQTCDGHA